MGESRVVRVCDGQINLMTLSVAVALRARYSLSIKGGLVKSRRWNGHQVRANDPREKDRQRDCLLHILRNQFNTILKYKCEKIEVFACLMAYDCGVASDLFGIDSAVYVGLKKGLDDFVYLYPAEAAGIEIGRMEELGRRSSAQVRSMVQVKTPLFVDINICQRP
jgi:hypothetical protein